MTYFTLSYDPNPVGLDAAAASAESASTTQQDAASSSSSASSSGQGGGSGSNPNGASSSSGSSSSSGALVKAAAREQVILDTDPLYSTTRYQQTILNFPKGVALEAGEAFTGTLAVRPAAACARDLDLEVELIYKGMHARSSYAFVHTHLQRHSTEGY